MSEDIYRIGDAERERAASRLADHFAEGRLDHAEYNERLDAIWTARTAADLQLLFHDLPLAQPAPPPAPQRPLAGPPLRGVPAWLILALVAVGVLLVMINPWLAVALVVGAVIFMKKRRRLQHHRHGQGHRPGHDRGHWQG